MTDDTSYLIAQLRTRKEVLSTMFFPVFDSSKLVIIMFQIIYAYSHHEPHILFHSFHFLPFH